MSESTTIETVNKSTYIPFKELSEIESFIKLIDIKRIFSEDLKVILFLSYYQIYIESIRKFTLSYKINNAEKISIEFQIYKILMSIRNELSYYFFEDNPNIVNFTKYRDYKNRLSEFIEENKYFIRLNGEVVTEGTISKRGVNVNGIKEYGQYVLNYIPFEDMIKLNLLEYMKDNELIESYLTLVYFQLFNLQITYKNKSILRELRNKKTFYFFNNINPGYDTDEYTKRKELDESIDFKFQKFGDYTQTFKIVTNAKEAPFLFKGHENILANNIQHIPTIVTREMWLSDDKQFTIVVDTFALFEKKKLFTKIFKANIIPVFQFDTNDKYSITRFKITIEVIEVPKENAKGLYNKIYNLVAWSNITKRNEPYAKIENSSEIQYVVPYLTLDELIKDRELFSSYTYYPFQHISGYIKAETIDEVRRFRVGLLRPINIIWYRNKIGYTVNSPLEVPMETYIYIYKLLYKDHEYLIESYNDDFYNHLIQTNIIDVLILYFKFPLTATYKLFTQAYINFLRKSPYICITDDTEEKINSTEEEVKNVNKELSEMGVNELEVTNIIYDSTSFMKVTIFKFNDFRLLEFVRSDNNNMIVVVYQSLKQSAVLDELNFDTDFLDGCTFTYHQGYFIDQTVQEFLNEEPRYLNYKDVLKYVTNTLLFDETSGTLYPTL